MFFDYCGELDQPLYQQMQDAVIRGNLEVLGYAE